MLHVHVISIGDLRRSPVDGDAVQSSVVEHDDAVRVEREALQREHRVVRLHHHVVRMVPVREHGVCLYISYDIYISAYERKANAMVRLISNLNQLLGKVVVDDL